MLKLAQPLVALFAIALPCYAAASGYAICRDGMTGQELLQCNKTSCPAGTTLIAYNPGEHASCNGKGGGGEYDPKPAAEQCHTSKHLRDLGYSKGHKTRYCQNHGYDGNIGWNCIRDCTKKCVKANLRKLGWIKNSKSEFCKKLGYDGVHGAAGSKYGEAGYCYKGDPAICKL